MARAQIKLLLFLIVLGILLGCVGGAWWVYQNVLMRDAVIAQEVAQLHGKNRPVLDPGARRFDAAIDLIRTGELDKGREALYKLLQTFPASPTCKEAKRIIGEMNMDALYRLDASGGKKDYIVQPRDSLLAIAGRNHTTIEALSRINALTTINLQPGEHLFVIPMDFDLAVDVSDKKVTLLRAGRFFKEYEAIDIKLLPNTRVPAEMEIASKSAIVDNKQANPVTPDFIRAEKRITVNKNATTLGLVVRTPPAAEPVVEGKAAAPENPASRTGLFLRVEDLEELYPILRKGSKFRLVQ